MKKPKGRRKFRIGRTAEAYIFLTPFILGVLVFFLIPLFTSIKLSFGELTGASTFDLQWLSWPEFFDHYSRALFVDTSFVPILLKEVQQMLLRAPLIIAFSMILAIAISRKIRGRGFFRLAFFLPFLLGTGNVLQQMLNVGVDSQVLSMESITIIPPYILSYLGPGVIDAVNTFFSVIVLVLWNCSVQILLFMSGVQAIPPQLYESASVDGASEWEKFWKITLPMLTPVILLNTVYTITESFTHTTNNMMNYIRTRAFSMASEFEFASAATNMYTLVVLLFIGIVFLVLGRRGMQDVREGRKRRQ